MFNIKVNLLYFMIYTRPQNAHYKRIALKDSILVTCYIKPLIGGNEV